MKWWFWAAIAVGVYWWWRTAQKNAGTQPGLTNGAPPLPPTSTGNSFRQVTANGTVGGVPFGAQAVDRSKPPPAEKAYNPRTKTTSSSSATSTALNNSALNTAEQYSIAGGVATAKAFGIPPTLSRPIAKYGNPIALGKDVVVGGQYAVSGVKTAASAVGSATSSAAHAVASGVSKAFSWL